MLSWGGNNLQKAEGRSKRNSPRKLKEVMFELGLGGWMGGCQTQGTEKEFGVKGPAWAKALGRKPALSACLLSEMQTLLTHSIKRSLKLTWKNNPEHLLNTRFLELYCLNISESKLFHTVWPQQCVESFSVGHNKYFSFTVKSGMFGKGLY